MKTDINYRLYSKVTVINTVWYQHKERPKKKKKNHQWKQQGNETDPLIYNYLICN